MDVAQDIEQLTREHTNEHKSSRVFQFLTITYYLMSGSSYKKGYLIEMFSMHACKFLLA